MGCFLITHIFYMYNVCKEIQSISCVVLSEGSLIVLKLNCIIQLIGSVYASKDTGGIIVESP